MPRIVALATMVATALGHQHAKNSMFVHYMADGARMRGYMTYKPAVCTATSKCPAVVIIQDWNGMNEYEQERACMLADMGYVAFAADIYGVDMPTATFTDWVMASGAHRSNATKYMSKIHGAISQVMTYDFVDTSKMAAIGYCFGGTGLINIAMTGYAGFPGITFPTGLLGLVSFHGGLASGYEAPVAGDRPKLMVHSGAQDDSNEHITNLSDHLESVNAIYEINRYGSGVVHSFTDWDAAIPTNMYSAFADQRSWEATTHFFHELFSTGVDPVGAPDLSAAHSDYAHMDVSYIADGSEMMGWMVYNSSHCTSESKCPAVIVVQDWDGMNDYEKERAYLLAQEGYVALAADIYGVDVPKETMQDWIQASGDHSSNATKYMNKIHGAISQAMTYEFVNTDKMAAVGYCFGGTGMINVAMAGYDGFPDVNFPTGLRGVVSFHGGISNGYVSPSAGDRPKVLIHAGAKDGSISSADLATLTDDLEGLDASYEITRYGSGVGHAFTKWDAGDYDSRADLRSWQDTTMFLHELFFVDHTENGTHPDSGASMCNLEPAMETGPAWPGSGTTAAPDSGTDTALDMASSTSSVTSDEVAGAGAGAVLAFASCAVMLAALVQGL